ncbi:1-acyl-sn-glycerol-3-phosphate acyltransferase [bacterium]|nr:1-acyl-sn-glycerol-3-phosphate acyltransferase [bacterium]
MWLSKIIPTFVFYVRMINAILRCAYLGRKDQLKGHNYSWQSWRMLRAMEAAGGKFQIDGLDHIRNLDGPVVFVANHMSTLETFTLPGIIRPFRDMTFIVKESLTHYPIFKHVMNAQGPIAVKRINAREDLKIIMTKGVEKLKNGTSIVVFPQTTRMQQFDPSQFNTIGVKLAARAGVSVIPIALRTDAWEIGRLMKDYGPVDNTKPIYFVFGKPIHVEGNGKEAQKNVVAFIQKHMEAWFGREGIVRTDNR